MKKSEQVLEAHSGLQNTAEWREARIGKVTASRAGAILGVDKRMSRDDIMRQMVREYHGAEDEVSDFVRSIMDHGKQSEEEALSAIQSALGVFIDPSGFILHPKIDWIGCSPDGLIGEDEGVEVKCPTKNRKNLDDVLEDEGYRCQCLMSLLVTGREKWTLFVYRDRGIRQKVFLREEAERWLSENVDELNRFYREYLDTVSCPDLSKPHLEPLEVGREDVAWSEAASKYLKAMDDLAAAKANASVAKQELVDLSDGRKSRGSGVLVYPDTGRKSTNYARAVQDAGLDVSGYQTEGSPSWIVKICDQEVDS